MRLRTRRDYLSASKAAKRFAGDFIILDVKDSSLPSSRIGITVTKKFGNACQRNRFKRITKEAFRLLFPSLKSSFDLVIRPRSKALEASMQEIQTELSSLIQRIESSLPNTL